MICPHTNCRAEFCDQTLGASCNDCGKFLGCCWSDDHVSEAIWNRVCLSDPDARPCKQNRDNYCFLCEGEIRPMVTVYTVSTNNRIHVQTLSLAEAEQVATQAYKDTGIIPDVFASERRPYDHTKEA